MHYKIGTRGSQLALAQTRSVAARLASACPEDTFEIVVLTSRGDRLASTPLPMLGAGAFVRELQEQLLAGAVDVLVHSMKDLPAEEPPGLTLTKAWTRADARDALVTRSGGGLASLPPGAIVATGSVRRRHFLRLRRPDLRFVEIRGNVDTRLRRLFESDSSGGPAIDALVLAAAGLDRLGRSEAIAERLDPKWMIPAPNQGQLAIEVRAADVVLKAKIDALGDDESERIAAAERGYLHDCGATCRDAVAAFAHMVDGEIVTEKFFAPAPRGRVTLVGAGPGDPGLITVKGLAAIRSADAIVCDRLVPAELLGEVRPGCERYDVGKQSGHHSAEQREINELLCELALRHAQVVRLKGGDPFVFGRGGEEVAYLRAHGIECTVVPGVTSAVAATGSAGIPLTHRGAAAAFRVVAAHGADFSADDLDYASMLDPHTTLVFMMGFAQLAGIASGLIRAGRPPSTPSAVIASGTTPHERTVRGGLGEIAGLSAQAGLAAPAVLVVGDVVEFGRKCLVGKIGDKPSSLAARLRSAGATVEEFTAGRIRPLECPQLSARAAQCDWLIVTSANAVASIGEQVVAVLVERQVKVAAVGPATAAAAAARGLHVEVVPDAANSLGLLSCLLPRLRSADRVLRLLPRDCRDSLSELSGHCVYETVEVYVNEPVPRRDFPDFKSADEVYFTSKTGAFRSSTEDSRLPIED